MTRWVCGGVLVLFAATAIQVRAENCALIRVRIPVRVPNPFGGGGTVVQPVRQTRDVITEVTGPRRVRGAGIPAGPPKFDRHGDPMPPGAVARYGTVRLRHGPQPEGLGFSPDGKVLGSVSTAADGVRLWDPATGKELARLNSPVEFAAFARDGSVLAVFEGRCKHWVPAGNTVRDLPEKTLPENAQCVAVNPDLRSFAAGAAKKVVLIDIQTGKHLRDLNLPGDKPPTRLAYSPDGRWLAASGQQAGVCLWNLGTNKRVRTYTSEAEQPEFAFSSDGTRLVICGGGVLNVFPVDSDEVIDGFAEFSSDRGDILNPRFSADGKWVFGAYADGQFVRVNAATGEGDEPQAAPVAELHPPIAVSPAGSSVAAIDQSGGIRIWDPKTGKGPEADRLPALEAPGFSPDGKAVWVLDAEGKLHSFEAATGKPIKVTTLSAEEGAAVVWDPVARRATTHTGGDEFEIQVIDVDAGKVVAKLTSPTDRGAPFVAFFPTDRNRVALFTQGQVAVVNAASGKTIRTITFGKADESPLSRGAVSPDGRLVAVSTPLSVWELGTGKKRFRFDAVADAEGTTFSRDGRYLAAWSGMTVVVFDLRLGTIARRIEMDGNTGPLVVAFSPDGKRLATGDAAGAVTVWDMGTGEPLLTFARHDGTVNGVAWSPDGTRLASAAGNGTVLVWDVPAKGSDAPAVVAVAGFDEAFRLLGSADPATAQRGMEFLYRRPAEAVKQCADRVPVPVAAAPARIARLLADLADENFPVRQAAVKELESIGGEAVPHLRATAAKSPSAEARKLAGDSLVRIDARPPGADELRAARAVEVLEGLNTAESRLVLAKWAGGPAGHRLTADAAAALARLPK